MVPIIKKKKKQKNSVYHREHSAIWQQGLREINPIGLHQKEKEKKK